MNKKTPKKGRKEFSDLTVLVVGDVALDVYVQGEVERISQEAPAPIVLETSRSHTLGCAANVANNIVSLGGKALLLGVIGSDKEGAHIHELCKGQNVTPLLVTDPGRPTTVKTRILARRHQLMRIDRETKDVISKHTEEELIAKISKLKEPDLVIISDYHKGVLTETLVDTIRRAWRDVRIIADFKPTNSHIVRNVFAITPNLKEALEMTGLYADIPSRATEAVKLLAQEQETSVVLKRGEHGMTIFEQPSGRLVHIPSHPIRAFDVTGAGDTVIAALALMCAAGEDLITAAEFANSAAGSVVSKEGTAVTTREEIERLIQENEIS